MTIITNPCSAAAGDTLRTGLDKRVVPRLRELAPRGQGSQEAGFTQPRLLPSPVFMTLVASSFENEEEARGDETSLIVPPSASVRPFHGPQREIPSLKTSIAQ